MPDLEIHIGGRSFSVACQPGEEHFLRAAALMLDSEAQPLVAQLGRLPESRLLLMAGLMLADKTASVEDENRQLKLKLAEIEARPPLEREKIEVAVVPAGLFETLSEIAARAESVASLVEENARQ
jgi:cell division protein ZapA